MKSFFFILFGLIGFGTLLGILVSNVSEKPYVPEGQVEAAIARKESIKAAIEARDKPGSAVAIADCDSDTFHFGLMDPLTVAAHTFYIENKGTGPLLLTGGESSCKCTLSDLQEAVVQPGDRYPVRLTWNSGHAKKSFKQLASVRTNDELNQEIRLTVMGEVRSVLTAMPSSLNLDRLIPETPAEQKFVLYSQIWEDLDIVKIESSTPQITGTVSPSDADQRYARDDEIQNATSKAVVNVKYDGTAPRGDFQGVLFVHVRPPTNWQSERSTDKEALLDVSSEHAAMKLVSLNRPQSSQDRTEQTTTEVPPPSSANLPINEDGILVCEIPFYGKVVRRLSLYGKVVGNEGSVNLGKLHPKDVVGSSWTIVGRIRGTQLPSEIKVAVSGIPGLKAVVQEATSSKANNSFRVQLELTEALSPAIFDDAQAGTLVLEAPGMPSAETRLELPINLTVIEY